MMPNDRAGRGHVLRGAAVGIAGIVLVVLAALAFGPLASSSSSSATPPTGGTQPASSAAIVPSGSPAPAGTSRPDTPAPSASTSPAPQGGASDSPAPPSASPTPAPSLIASRLQRTLDRVRAQLSIPGASVAILWDDGRTWTGASGVRNVATGDPMTPGTAFALASISKTFTAAVVMELVEAGKLTLDQPVAPLLPAYRLDRRITVRMLLDHTSGLPDFFFGKGIDAALQGAKTAAWTPLQSWSYVPKPHAVPGKSWIYSNTNYLLLGELVTAVTGKPLATEIRTRLLDPLGLTSAYYQAVEKPRQAGTLAYQLVAKAGGGWTARRVAPASDVMPFRSVVTAAGGAGSMAATALDTARWMRAWAGGQVLTADVQAQVLADVARTVKLHATIPYGLGIQRVTLNGYTALGHSGRYLGFRNVVRYLPQAGVTIAVLTNQSTWDPNRIASALLKAILPTPSPSASASASPSASAPGATHTPSPSPSAR
jgi:D-alanyl-D-alanine carboxypeptidase